MSSAPPFGARAPRLRVEAPPNVASIRLELLAGAAVEVVAGVELAKVEAALHPGSPPAALTNRTPRAWAIVAPLGAPPDSGPRAVLEPGGAGLFEIAPDGSAIYALRLGPGAEPTSAEPGDPGA